MKLVIAEKPSVARATYHGMIECCYSKAIITKRDTVSHGFVLGQQGEGKAFGVMLDEDNEKESSD